MNDDLMMELEKLAKPIIELMQSKMNPYASIVIEDGMLKVKEDLCKIVYNKRGNK